MSSTLRVGLVGTSWWSEAFHIAGLASHPQAELVAICGRNRDRATEVSERAGRPRVFTDYREMITSGLLDALIVAAPDHLHKEVAVTAIASGLHVLCEKPLARSAEDARQMLALADAAGVVHMVMFTWRWAGVFAYLKQLVSSGYIGRCRDAVFTMYGDHGCDPVYAWRFDPARGTGITGDFGSHMIDLARWYLGDVVEVSARLSTHVDRPSATGGPAPSLDDSASVLLEFAGRAHAVLDVSAVRSAGDIPTQRVSLFGDEGSVEAVVESGAGAVRGRRRGEDAWRDLPVPIELLGLDGQHRPVLGVPFLAPFTNLQVGDRLFVDAALGQARAEPNFQDGWLTQQIVDAAIRSDRDRRWVSVT